jgi:hypothetical protein
MNKGFPEPRIVDPMVEAPSWHYEAVPVIDGVATFPDGTSVHVPVADVLPLIPEEPDDAAHPDCGERCLCYQRGVNDEWEATRD